MTTTITVHHQHGDKSFTASTGCTERAEKLVRFSFNPSTQADVTRIKAIGAALITECQIVSGSNPHTENAHREAEAAILLIQQAVMMAVGAATFHLIEGRPAA